MAEKNDFGAQSAEGSEEQRKQALAELGGKLRQLREAQNISYTEVAQEIKIQKHYVQAMEEGRIEDLPRGPFVRSFLRQYCSYLSADDMWPKYDELTQAQAIKVVIPEAGSQASYVQKSPKVFRPEKHTFLFIVLALLGALAIYLMIANRAELSSTATNPIEGGTAVIAEQAVRPEPQPEPVKAVSEDKKEEAPAKSSGTAEKPAEKSADTTPVKEAQPEAKQEIKKNSAAETAKVDLGWLDGKEYKEPEPVVAEQKAPEAVKAEATQEKADTSLKKTEIRIIPKAVIWVKVSRGNEIYFQGLVKPGDNRVFDASGDRPLRVRYGNPGKTGIIWNGRKIENVGTDKTPMTRFYHADGSVTAD